MSIYFGQWMNIMLIFMPILQLGKEKHNFFQHSCFANRVDPNQLVSQKPADQDPHCFLLCEHMLIIEILRIKSKLAAGEISIF